MRQSFYSHIWYLKELYSPFKDKTKFNCSRLEAFDLCARLCVRAHEQYVYACQRRNKIFLGAENTFKKKYSSPNFIRFLKKNFEIVFWLEKVCRGSLENCFLWQKFAFVCQQHQADCMQYFLVPSLCIYNKFR